MAARLPQVMHCFRVEKGRTKLDIFYFYLESKGFSQKSNREFYLHLISYDCFTSSQGFNREKRLYVDLIFIVGTKICHKICYLKPLLAHSSFF